MSPWGPAAPWWLVVAGCGALVALWHTSVLALLLELWRASAPAASARRQYAVAALALTGAVALTVATPFVLVWSPASPVAGRVRGIQVPAASSSGPHASLAQPRAIPTPSVPARQVARLVEAAVPWIGAVALAGVLVSATRVAGGWGLAQWIRRRATAVDSPIVIEAAAAARAEWGLPDAALLASAHVDAPVVVGARTPAVLLPADLGRQLGADALSPLLAHELAHVRRRDYAANLAQSVADALLWFSPGARLISRRIREAREYCCDDVVAAHCGAGPYASALTTLAGLGALTRSRPALNAVGPRLIVRIRRLLQEDTMIQFRRLRLIGLSASTAAAVLVGLGLQSVTSSALASAGGRPSLSARAPQTPITVSFDRDAGESGVVVEGVEPTAGGLCGVATLRSDAAVAVQAVLFVAEVMRGHKNGALFGGGKRSVAITPGQTARVALNLVPPNDALAIGGSGRADVLCRLAWVGFADGSSWSLPPGSVARRPQQATAADVRTVSGEVARWPIPYGYVPEQKGAAVTLRQVTWNESSICGSAVVENRANVPVAALRFVAFAMPRRGSHEPREEAMLTSEWLAVDVEPGATATIDVGLMSRDDVFRLGGPDPQVQCALTEIRYANDAWWRSAPLVVFAPQHPEIPRALIGAPAPSTLPVCKDAEGDNFSHGAIVRVALEPGTFATCSNGQWIEGRRPVGAPAPAR